MFAIFKFVTFNTILPLFDMGTDVKAFIFYLTAGVGVAFHPNWAWLTLFWIVVPFLIHLAKFFYILATTGEANWRDLFLHIPFVLPLRNLFYAYKLFGMRFGIEEDSFWVKTLGMRAFNSKDFAKVEWIQKQVAKDGLTESYFESGPQALEWVGQWQKFTFLVNRNIFWHNGVIGKLAYY